MKKYIIMFSALLAVGLYAAQDAALTIRQVRDPVQLRDKLNANATDAQARLLVVESSLGTNTTLGVTVASLTTTGTVTIAEGALTASTVTTTTIKDATIVNADISATAAIAQTKIATNTLGATTLVFLSTDGKTNTLTFTAVGILSGNTITP
jgi:hypothetical protein